MSLYQVKPMMDPLEREAQEVARRRQRLEDRKPRVLHQKTRLIGIDTQALDYQVNEKQDRMRCEMERDVYFDSMTNKHAKMLVEQESIYQMETKARMQDLNRFRAEQQKQQERNAAAIAASAEDYKNDKTTFLQFRGVDGGAADRRSRQQAQQMDWLNQQVDQKIAKEQSEFNTIAQDEQEQRRILEFRGEQEAMQEADRRNQAVMNNRMNQSLALEKNQREARAARKQASLDQAEIKATLSSDFMTETRTDGQRETFKGFTKAQRAAILEEQARQVTALQERQAAASDEQQKYENDCEAVRRSLVIAERKKQASRRMAAVQLRQEHELQRNEKNMRYDYLDNVVYTNPVDDSFFQQFGQSVR